MSKVNAAKTSQGYRIGKLPVCGNCQHLKFDLELPKWMQEANEESSAKGTEKRYGEEYALPTNIKCSIGGFAVKKMASCNLFSHKE